MKENKRGITLIALIITIIVMLILVGVTINLSANGGLFNKTREGSKETEKWAIYDQIVNAMHLTEDGKINVKETFESFSKNFGKNKVEKDDKKSNDSQIVFTVQGNRGKYTYTITEEKIIIGIEEAEETDDYAILKRYFLGANGEGRKVNEWDEFFMQTENGEFRLVDDHETEVDESSLEMGGMTVVGEGLSLKCNDSIYKINFTEYVDKDDEDNPEKNYTLITGIEKIYTQNSNREGRDLGEVTGDSKYDGWTILYDYGSYVEAVSPTSMGSVHLGSDTDTTDLSTEEAKNIEYNKAIDSYDNAIETINNCCKNLSKLPENSGVRSVGAEKDEIKDYYDLDPLKNNWANGRGFEIKERGKVADEYYLQDIARIFYYNKLATSNNQNYVIASRFIAESADEYTLGIYMVKKYYSDEGDVDRFELGGGYLFDLEYDFTSPYAFSKDLSVRPIIKVKI